jgi:hypothetical protein
MMFSKCQNVMMFSQNVSGAIDLSNRAGADADVTLRHNGSVGTDHSWRPTGSSTQHTTSAKMDAPCHNEVSKFVGSQRI